MPQRMVEMSTRAPMPLIGLVVFFSLSALAQPAPAKELIRPEVLVLGVYHMNNPGLDIFNTETDDVLSPRRQAEMRQLLAVLEKFRPTKIAVEASFSRGLVQRAYTEYAAGERELTRNEIEQLGFRLAKELRHETVYPVDVDGEFPYPRLVKFAQATGRTNEFDTLQEEMAEKTEAFSAYLASHTLLETLLYMNSDEQAAEAVGSYFRLAEFGEPWDWAGADLVSEWFRRNLRIYSNIMQLIDSPNERVLVIYGAGHLGWLQFAFDSNPGVRLRKLAEFTR